MNERVSKCNISPDLSGKLSFFSREKELYLGFGLFFGRTSGNFGKIYLKRGRSM